MRETTNHGAAATLSDRAEVRNTHSGHASPAEVAAATAFTPTAEAPEASATVPALGSLAAVLTPSEGSRLRAASAAVLEAPTAATLHALRHTIVCIARRVDPSAPLAECSALAAMLPAWEAAKALVSRRRASENTNTHPAAANGRTAQKGGNR